MDNIFKTPKGLEMTDTQELLDKMVADISTNHSKILDDWYKANVAQIYEETREIRPCDFTLNQQPVHEEGRCVHGQVPIFTGYKYWFSRNTDDECHTNITPFQVLEEEALRITFVPEKDGLVTDFEIHPRNIRKLIETLERALGEVGDE